MNSWDPVVYCNQKEFDQQKKYMKKTSILATICLLLVIQSKTSGQSVSVPLTLDQWDTIGVNPVKENYKGKDCFLLSSGAIILKRVQLRDGTIEADISFPQKRNFPGFLVRMQDLRNAESFYMRPHQSGNPDAIQYTPLFNSQAGWQLYYGEGYGGAFPYRFNEWHHIKIDLHGLQAEFYIDDTAIIKVKELLTGWKAGRIAVIAEGGLFGWLIFNIPLSRHQLLRHYPFLQTGPAGSSHNGRFQMLSIDGQGFLLLAALFLSA